MKTTETLIAIVEEAIRNGLARQSYIEPWVNDLKCWSTPEIKSMLNHIGRSVESYLEVGVFHGGTFFSTVAGSSDLKAYAVDIFVEDVASGPSNSFRGGLDRMKRDNVKFLNKDCFTVDQTDIPESIEAYLYDGPHHKEEQERALTHYVDFMKDKFIFMVDDFNDADVVEGTRNALENLKDKIKVEKEWVFKTTGNMGLIWWNGYYIAVISKIDGENK